MNTGYNQLNKFLRYSLKTIAWTLGIIVIIWMALWIYVSLNEKALIRKLSYKIHERTRGEVAIGGLSVSFFRTFPLLSLQLSDILIRDSLYAIHKKDFLKAEDIYLRVSIPGLITGRSPVGKVIISDGSVTILTDSSGVTNNYILKSGNKEDKDKEETSKKKKASAPDILLRNVLFTFINPLRNKFHQASIQRMTCSIKELGERMEFGIDLNLLVRSLAFNTEKGSFLRGKQVEGDFILVFDKKAKNLEINNVELDIEGHPFVFNGKFHLDKTSPDFNLAISVHDINFSKAVSFLPDSLQKKMTSFSLNEPVSARAELSGKTFYRFIPLAKVTMNVKGNELITPMGTFQQCTFNGLFTNEMVAGKPRLDDNALVHISDFSANWENIRLVSKSIKLSNLISPFVDLDLRSDIELKSLNDLTGSQTFNFISGTSSVNVLFKGPIGGNDSVVSNINGDIAIKDASIKYLPRDFVLSNCNGTFTFKNNDLLVQKFNMTAGQTKLQMNGHARHFLSMLNISPQKPALHWKIYSDRLRLEDFRAFLSKAETSKKQGASAKLKGASTRIDRLFSDGDIYIDLETPKMDFKNFEATAVHANAIMKSTEIALENMTLNHAKGSIALSGSMKDGKGSNPISLHAQMRNMDIPVLFKSFDNFGQDAITHANLKGRLSADVKFSSAITNKATLVNSASKGMISFLLEDGELNNFEPLQKVSEKVFKKQDFTEIRFADLKNKLEVNGSSFVINEMEIRSTALHFFVEGIYDIKNGTDMSIRLPIRNLLKSQANIDLSDAGKQKAGISVRLRAKTGDDGKLSVSWDPFKRSVKHKEAVADSTLSQKRPDAPDSTLSKNKSATADSTRPKN